MSVPVKANPYGILGTDSRNLGGRIQIVQQVKNHHKALVKAKKNLDTFKKPMKHINERAKASGQGTTLLKNALDFEEVVVSFKKVANLKKGYVSTNAPKCLETKKLRAPGNHKTQKEFELSEHQKNLNAMKNKLKNMGKNMNERKKNVWDPVAHPVRFFRRNPLDPMANGVGKKMGIELDCLANKLIHRRDVVGVDNSRLLERQIKTSNDMRSKSARNSMYTQNETVTESHVPIQLTDSE